MAKRRRLILVTGAPRSATTPVGNLLAQCRGAVSLYEPLGPTGVTWMDTPFPMVGDGLGLRPDQLAKLIDDFSGLRLGSLKPQARSGAASLRSTLLGSRTLHSYRLARLQPWAGTVVWKDPHAIMMVPDLIDAGVAVVVTARAPRAHAASYKRLKWEAKAAEIYPRWSKRYGACETCERFLDKADDPVVAAALLWRLSYLPLLRTGALGNVHMVTSEQLERDERATYLDLIQSLGLDPTDAVRRTLDRPRREAAAADMSHKAHDWSRSVASVNRYWREVLSKDDLDHVHAITDDVAKHFFAEADEEAVPVSA